MLVKNFLPITAWQIKKDLASRQNTACRALAETDKEYFELEPRQVDELHSGSEVWFELCETWVFSTILLFVNLMPSKSKSIA